jgi:membrane-bound ClpP family serine protease
MTDPWLTLALMLTGMTLLISQLMSLSPWGWSGTAAVFCLGAVVASYSIAGALAWTAALLLIAGIGLLIVESRVFAGYGISGMIGLGCLFLGLYTMLAAWGILYASLASAMMTILAAIAFLVHLPQNPKWQMIGRRLQITIAHPAAVEQGCAEITGTGKAQIKRTTHVRPTAEEKSEDEQIIRRDE